MLSIYSIYYSTAFTPVIIDSIIYSVIFVLLASILPVHASAGSADKFKRNRNILAAALGPLFAIVLLTYNLNLYILVAGGLLWVLIFLILLLIFVSAVKFLPKKFKIPFGFFVKNPWLLPLIILVLAILFRFFLLTPLSLGLKRVLDFIIYFAMFALLMTIAFQSRKKDEEKYVDKDIKKLSKRLEDQTLEKTKRKGIEAEIENLKNKKKEIQNKKKKNKDPSENVGGKEKNKETDSEKYKDNLSMIGKKINKKFKDNLETLNRNFKDVSDFKVYIGIVKNSLFRFLKELRIRTKYLGAYFKVAEDGIEEAISLIDIYENQTIEKSDLDSIKNKLIADLEEIYEKKIKII